MPSKSRRGQGRRSERGKKRGSSQGLVTGVQQQATAKSDRPVSPVPAPSVKVLTPRPTLSPVQHPYLATELRRLAILAGIMLIVLVVLYLVIP